MSKFRLGWTALALLGGLYLSGQALAAEGKCCARCGCCLTPVCRTYCETKKVTEYKYRCVSQEICVPGVTRLCEGGSRCERCGGCEGGCDACNSACRESCPTRCLVRDVHKLVKYPVTKEVPVKKCVVEWVCPNCCGEQCGPTSAPAAAPGTPTPASPPPAPNAPTLAPVPKTAAAAPLPPEMTGWDKAVSTAAGPPR